ncbi:MAG: AAA family ATPase [Oscillospiraceae bacterium]
MNKVITISREFGSGGRELGKRLAEILEIAYYDHEIIAAISERSGLAEEYVSGMAERRPVAYPITIGQTLTSAFTLQFEHGVKIYAEQSNIIKELALKSDCVIIGRCSDYILRNYSPLKIFVYADTNSRLRRCRERAPKSERLSDSQIKAQLLEVDKQRAKYHNFFTGEKWGQKENYTLCINTSNTTIKNIATPMAQLLKAMLPLAGGE